MIDCAYCQRPLICEGCQTPHVPSSQAEYEALFRTELPVVCKECGRILVCHWCKTPYDGSAADEDARDEEA